MTASWLHATLTGAPPRSTSRIALALLLGITATSTVYADPHCAPAGASSLLAPMPVVPAFPPRGAAYPEGIALVDSRVVVSGPATFGTAGNGTPSQLTVFDRESGALLDEVPLVGEDLSQEHALSELFASKHHLYAPSTQLGVVRWPSDGANAFTQESYSTPFCSVTIPFPCLAPTDRCPADIRPGLPPLPNGIVVDNDGDVYVTDSLQGIVWHMRDSDNLPIVPEVLFCSAALQGAGSSGLTLFGANGIAVVGKYLYVSVTFGPIGMTGHTSVIYRLPKRDPKPADLTVVYSYEPEEVAPGVFVPPIADGLRYDSKSKRLFVVLGGLNAVSVLDIKTSPAVETSRYYRTDPDHPFFNPATIDIDKDGRAYVANHAITCCLPGDPSPDCAGCSNAQDYFGVIELCVD